MPDRKTDSETKNLLKYIDRLERGGKITWSEVADAGGFLIGYITDVVVVGRYEDLIILLGYEWYIGLLGSRLFFQHIKITQGDNTVQLDEATAPRGWFGLPNPYIARLIKRVHRKLNGKPNETFGVATTYNEQGAQRILKQIAR